MAGREREPAGWIRGANLMKPVGRALRAQELSFVNCPQVT
jgi:hypothetical protein